MYTACICSIWPYRFTCVHDLLTLKHFFLFAAFSQSFLCVYLAIKKRHDFEKKIFSKPIYMLLCYANSKIASISNINMKIHKDK